MAKNYSVNHDLKTIYVDFDKLTRAEEKAVDVMARAGYAVENKRVMSEDTKKKMISPKAMFEFISSGDNAKTYADIIKKWNVWKKEKVSYINKRREVKTREGGDMHARKMFKATMLDEYTAIVAAIKKVRGIKEEA